MSSITINQLIKNTIEQNRYSKKKVALAAGISEKTLHRILNSDDIDISALFLLSRAIGFKVTIEFSNDQTSIKFPLIQLGHEDPAQD